jgi:hypothetical protein
VWVLSVCYRLLYPSIDYVRALADRFQNNHKQCSCSSCPIHLRFSHPPSMAGFLRKKNKDGPGKPVPSAPMALVTTVSPSPPAPAPAAPLPPLFARFSTSSSTTKSANGTPSPRMVSSPMVLTKKDPKAASRGHGQVEAARRRSSKSTGAASTVQKGSQDPPAQNQGPSKSLFPVQSVHVHSEPLTPPVPIVNKLLPPPSSSSPDPSGSSLTQSSAKQGRAPSAFQNQPRIDNLPNTEENQPPSFYSAQSSFTSLVSSPASRRSSTSNPLTSPSKRNLQLSSTNLAPQILPPIANRKISQQNLPPPAFGRQNLPTTAAQTQTPHLAQPSSVENQDLQPANVDDNMSMTGASSYPMGIPQSDSERRSLSSDRSVDIDLPPEFASLFHVSLLSHFSLVLDEETSSESLSSREVNPQIPRTP